MTIVELKFNDELPFKSSGSGIFVAFEDRTIATIAKFIWNQQTIIIKSITTTLKILTSLRIINDTKNPDHDKKYSTRRAGISKLFGFILLLLLESNSSSVDNDDDVLTIFTAPFFANCKLFEVKPAMNIYNNGNFVSYLLIVDLHLYTQLKHSMCELITIYE